MLSKKVFWRVCNSKRVFGAVYLPGLLQSCIQMFKGSLRCGFHMEVNVQGFYFSPRPPGGCEVKNLSCRVIKHKPQFVQGLQGNL